MERLGRDLSDKVYTRPSPPRIPVPPLIHTDWSMRLDSSDEQRTAAVSLTAGGRDYRALGSLMPAPPPRPCWLTCRRRQAAACLLSTTRAPGSPVAPD